MNKVDKEWLSHKYVSEKLSCGKIGKIVGCSGSWIRKLLIKFDIPINDRIYGRNILLNDASWLKRKYIDEKLSISKIAKKAQCSSGGVKSALNRFDIPRRSKSEGHICSREDDGIILDGEALEIINGGLLGDATIAKSKKNGVPVGNPHFSKTNINYDHIEFVAGKIFKINPINRISPTKSYGNQYFRITSLSHNELNSLYDQWYEENIGINQKIIPETLQITPTVLLHWFLDDGCASLVYKKYPNPQNNIWSLRVFFCTNGFREKDLDRLIEKIYDGVKIRLSKRRSHGGFGYILCVSEIDLEKFYKIIGKCPVKSLEYKWKYDELLKRRTQCQTSLELKST